MRRNTHAAALPRERQLAIGLVWGHLHAHQYPEAHALASGCLQLWPDDEHLRLMCAYAGVEAGQPVDLASLDAVRNDANGEWIELILLRAQARPGAAGAPGRAP